MEPTSDYNPVSLFSLLITSIAFGVIGYALARNKGRHVLPWTIVCLIPLLNIFCLTFLVGASSLRIERKLDALLARQNASEAGTALSGSVMTAAPALPAQD